MAMFSRQNAGDVGILTMGMGAYFAMDIAQTPARKVVYIAPMFVQIADGLGMRSILHIDYRSTCVKLASFGLQNGERVIHETS